MTIQPAINNIFLYKFGNTPYKGNMSKDEALQERLHSLKARLRASKAKRDAVEYVPISALEHAWAAALDQEYKRGELSPNKIELTAGNLPRRLRNQNRSRHHDKVTRVVIKDCLQREWNLDNEVLKEGSFKQMKLRLIQAMATEANQHLKTPIELTAQAELG